MIKSSCFSRLAGLLNLLISSYGADNVPTINTKTISQFPKNWDKTHRMGLDLWSHSLVNGLTQF